MSDWTAGPWTVQKLSHADGDLWLQIGFFRDGREVGPIAELKYLIAPEAEQWANARLIAAAPRLYEVLMLLMDPNGHFYDCLPGKRGNEPGSDCSLACQKIRAALAAARGEEESDG